MGRGSAVADPRAAEQEGSCGLLVLKAMRNEGTA